MIKKIITSVYHDIYSNIALEKSIFDSFDGNDMLLLWSNLPCVVCGRNQNVYDEVDFEYASTNNISISRRFSGGGAVYQDLGNLNYTIYTKNEHIDEVLDSIINPLKSLGLNCEISGRNDITVNNKKVSGFAYFAEEDKYMYHGTLLIDVNIDNLTRVLTPNRLKLFNNGINSVSSRVINIKSIIQKDVNEISECITNYHLNNGAVLEDSLNFNITQKDTLASPEWIFGQYAKFDYVYDIKEDDGIYSIHISVNQGIITSCFVSTDSVVNYTKTNISDLLIGKQYSEVHKKLCLHIRK